MSLDFAVLGRNGAPEKTVSLGVDMHHELITRAVAHDLARFEDFADYYEDAEISVNELPGLVEQIRTLRSQTGPAELQRFLDELGNLIAYAVAQQKTLHVIAD